MRDPTWDQGQFAHASSILETADDWIEDEAFQPRLV